MGNSLPIPGGGSEAPLREVAEEGRGHGAPIVGRGPELAALHRFLEPGRSGGAFLLTGGPGIGKTTLWEAGLAAARRLGLRALSARPSGAVAQLSFAGLADLLDQVDLGSLAGLPAPQLHALEVALLRVEPMGAPPEPRAISAGFLNVLRALTTSEPLLIAVDDVHWLDPPSADALTFAARRLQSHPVRFLLARRLGGPVALERALEPVGLEYLEVGALSLGATRSVLSERLGLNLPRRILRRIFETAGGNPLFVLELGRMVAERGVPAIGEEMPVPEVVEDLFGARVAELSAPVRRLLLAVALSADLRLSQLATVGDQTAVEDALDAGLLIADGERVRPAHPLLAAAARTHSSARERRELHLTLAHTVGDETLRSRHPALATVSPNPELAATISEAAARARSRGAGEDAVELGEQALRLTPSGSNERTERLLKLAEYLVVAGEGQRATDLLAPEVDRLPTGSARARAHLLLGEGRFVVSHLDEWGEYLERALAESEDEPALRAIVMGRKSRHAAIGRVERVREAEAWAVKALPDARRAGPEVEREVLHGLGWARAVRGRPIDDLRERFEAVSEDAFPIFRSLDRIAAERLAWRGHVDEARRAFARLLELSDERGEAWSYSTVRLQLCELYLRAGEWDAASLRLDEWDQSPDRELMTAAAYQRCRGLLAAGRGDPEDAERWAAAAIAGAEASGLRWNLLEALRVRGIAVLFAGDPPRAVASLSAVWDHTQREGVEDPGVFPVAPDLVEALADSGDLEGAAAVTGRLQQLAQEQEHPWGLATAKRCRALGKFAAGAYEEGAPAMAEAAVAYEQLGLRFDHARSLLSLGRAARRFKKWGVARRFLEEAGAAFEAIGSPGWADQGARNSPVSAEGGRLERKN